MMHIGSFAVKALGLFTLGFVPQDKPAPAVPAKPAEFKPGTTVIIQDKTIDKPGEPKKVEGIRVDGKKLEIREVGGVPMDLKKPVEYRIQAVGDGKSEKGVITIRVVGEPGQGGAKTETRTVTVMESADGTKPAVKTEARAFAFVVEGQPAKTPETAKVIKIVIGEDGKVIRTETQEVKGQQSQTLELQGVLKSVENASSGAHTEAIKKALEAVRGERIELRRIQVVGPDMKPTDTKPIILTPREGSATTGRITVTQTAEASKLDAILIRLEKIQKSLDELNAKGK